MGNLIPNTDGKKKKSSSSSFSKNNNYIDTGFTEEYEDHETFQIATKVERGRRRVNSSDTKIPFFTYEGNEKPGEGFYYPFEKIEHRDSGKTELIVLKWDCKRTPKENFTSKKYKITNTSGKDLLPINYIPIYAKNNFDDEIFLDDTKKRDRENGDNITIDDNKDNDSDIAKKLQDYVPELDGFKLNPKFDPSSAIESGWKIFIMNQKREIEIYSPEELRKISNNPITKRDATISECITFFDGLHQGSKGILSKLQ